MGSCFVLSNGCSYQHASDYRRGRKIVVLWLHKCRLLVFIPLPRWGVVIHTQKSVSADSGVTGRMGFPGSVK